MGVRVGLVLFMVNVRVFCLFECLSGVGSVHYFL